MYACVHNVGVMWLMKHSPVSLLHNAVMHCVCHSWQLLALSHVLDKHFMAHVVSFYCLWHHPKVAVLLKMWRNNELVNEWMRCVFYHTYEGGLKLLGGQKTIWFRLLFFFITLRKVVARRGRSLPRKNNSAAQFWIECQNSEKKKQILKKSLSIISPLKTWTLSIDRSIDNHFHERVNIVCINT